MRRLDRYVFREALGPLVIGFSVYTFIMIIRFLFMSAEMIIRRGVEAPIVGKLLLLTLPNIVVLTVPMALLFGVLTAVGRLASDSELVAIRSSGISLLALYRPILLLSVLLTLGNTALTLYVVPWGNSELQQLRLEILSQSYSRQVEPRVFYEDWDNKVLYVFDVDPETERWEGVFLAEGLTTQNSKVTIADWGRPWLDEAGEQVNLRMGDAITHEVNLNRPGRYPIQRTEEVNVLVDDSFTSDQKARISTSKSLRELDLPDLLDRINDPSSTAEEKNLAWVEVHKKFALPMACLVFGLFALPLGYNNRRGGKASGFVLSILVILVYYVMISNGEEAARFDKMPAWLAMWLPNIALSALGLFLLARKNRDKSLLLSRVDRWIRTDLWSRLLRLSQRREASRERRRQHARNRHQGPGEAAAGGARGLRLRVRVFRPRLAFPNLMDRYVLRLFLSVFLMVLLSALSLYVISDLSQKVDEIIKNQISRSTVGSYYFYLSFQILYEVAPIVMLVTTLLTFSLLSKSNEVTAAKALGMSLYRLAIPVIISAALFSAGAAYLQSEILPVTNQRAQQLEDRIEGRETSRTYRRTDRWLFGQDGYIYNFLHYDPDQKTLKRLQAFEISTEGEARLRSRLVAAEATYTPELNGGKGGWLFKDGWIRTFAEEGLGEEYSPFEGPVEAKNFNEDPDFFASEIRRPEQMGYLELRRYIDELEQSGQKMPELEVQLHNKLAFPVSSLVMVLVGLPFAFRLGRQGTLYGIGISIVLGMVFFAVLALFTALGEAGVLPVVVSVWSPSTLFTVYAIYLFLGVRT